ncbi:hypothetical protein SAMN05421833_112159 [Microbispora rosea]|uniref:ATPase domain-containing protein n=1 Tax=Microbispora rosea TaxID=58117 RepID=A0A1N7CRF0_9ACTN|nr:ATP-binding protein [Microbispora rosea]SIR66067.1 hypothetical protein SAMN05421833_112159 [Microbispora rosea]
MATPSKPAEIFDRDAEWAELERFVTNPDPGPNLAVVYGHRRQGKSFLLDHLARRYGGLYHVAAEDDPRTALDGFAASLAEWLGLAVPLRFADWKSGIEAAVEQMTRRSVETGKPALMVIDEYSYLLSGTPALSSYIQNAFDRYKRDRRGIVRIVLCGSAFSLMANLLSGDKPLYGRAALGKLIRPFDHRLAARFWNATHRPTALRLHAIVGGVPGYRMLAEAVYPTSGFHAPPDLDEWVVATVLNPASMLFQEHDRLLREDPRITHRALYQGVLRQIAQGVTKPGKIAAALGRDARSMKHPLDALVDTGLVRRVEDLVFSGKTSYHIAEPILRFAHAVILPRLSQLERGRARTVWERSADVFRSNILGPHFEDLVRDWLTDQGWARLGFSEPGEVGQTTISSGAEGQRGHQVDVVMLDPDASPRGDRVAIRILGEAKCTAEPRSGHDLRRLEKIRERMRSISKIDVSATHYAVFSESGFAADLLAEASRRDDVHLVDLDDLYE